MIPNPRPQFWLQVKKEYVIDNFDSLLNYLIQYTYDDSVENFDYDSTLECLHQLTDDICSVQESTPIYENPSYPFDKPQTLRILCADILASYKARLNPVRPVLTLAMFYLRSDLKLDSAMVEHLYYIITSCILGRDLTFTGIGWSDITNSDTNAQILFYKLKQMRFATSSSANENKYLDDKALLIISPSGKIDLSLVNMSLYSQYKYERIFDLPCDINVYVESDSFGVESDFARYYNNMLRLISSQDHYSPSPIRSIGVYTKDDCFPVRITSKFGRRIEAETVDPRYEKIVGKVVCELPPRRPHGLVLSDMLKIGDVIRVYRSSDREGFEFDVYDAFEDFYRTYASQCKACERNAIYVNSYSNGTEWITEDGIRVGIDKSKIQELDQEDAESFAIAIETGEPIGITLYNEAPDINKLEFNVYAEPSGFYDSADEVMFTQEKAEREMLKKFLNHCEESAGRIDPERANAYEPISKESIIPLTYALYRFSRCHGLSSRLKLEYLTVAAMIAKMCGRTQDMEYLIHDMSYLNAKVLFANDSEIRPISHPASLNDVDIVERKEDIITLLSGYKKKTPLSRQQVSVLAEDEDPIEKVETLVTASNSLVDIIDSTELNNIKQQIARTLEVEDEYVSILDDRTYYGVESIGMEFKTSVVFPPLNRRRSMTQETDPETQKWAILKAVCGFLNSRSGGDLLIGVNDAGYAMGLEADISALYQMKYISKPNEDKYRLYIMNMLSKAFLEKNGKMDSTDIANTHIDCFQEINAEGKSVMRVKIKPYMKKLIVFAAPVSERAPGTEDSYVRLSGRTVAVSPAMEEEILKYKN